MRIEVKTKQQVRVHVDLSQITSQTRILTNSGTHYLVHFQGGQTLDLSSEIPGIDVQEKDLRQKHNP